MQIYELASILKVPCNVKVPRWSMLLTELLQDLHITCSYSVSSFLSLLRQPLCHSFMRLPDGAHVGGRLWCNHVVAPCRSWLSLCVLAFRLPGLPVSVAIAVHPGRRWEGLFLGEESIRLSCFSFWSASVAGGARETPFLTPSSSWLVRNVCFPGLEATDDTARVAGGCWKSSSEHERDETLREAKKTICVQWSGFHPASTKSSWEDNGGQKCLYCHLTSTFNVSKHPAVTFWLT